MQKKSWKRLLKGVLLTVILQVFCVVMLGMAGGINAYVFCLLGTLAIQMWLAKLIEFKQRTFGRYLRDYLPALAVTGIILLLDALPALIWYYYIIRSISENADIDKSIFIEMFYSSYILVPFGFPIVQLAAAVLCFLIAVVFAIADYIARRR